MNEHGVASSAKNFAKSSLVDLTKLLNSGLPIIQTTESSGLNLFSLIRGIAEQGLGHFFITSSSSRFFNKTDFEKHLFKLAIYKRVFIFSRYNFFVN